MIKPARRGASLVLTGRAKVQIAGQLADLLSASSLSFPGSADSKSGSTLLAAAKRRGGTLGAGRYVNCGKPGGAIFPNWTAHHVVSREICVVIGHRIAPPRSSLYS